LETEPGWREKETLKTQSISYWAGPRIVTRLAYAERKCRRASASFEHVHNASHELVLCRKGKITVGTGGIKFILTPGDFLAVPKSKRHVVAVETDRSEFINVLFRGTLFDNLRNRLLPLNPEELELFDDLVEHAREPFQMVRAELAVADLTGILCRISLRLPEDPLQNGTRSANGKKYASDIVLKALDYLEDHYREPVSLEETADHTGISASHLRHLLLRETGSGFSVHLLQIRIAHARNLIESSSGNIKNIAADCGFNSLTFFYRVFKRLTGMTPAEYGRSVS